jgi:hypothetical protein
MRFFIVVDGERRGPLTLEQLAEQGIERDTLVWQPGLSDWARADEVPALAELMATVPPPVPRRAAPLPPPDLASAWVRYRPGSFKALHTWFVILLSTTLILGVIGAVLLIIAANMRSGRSQLVWDQFERRMAERWVFDREAHHRRHLMEVGGGLALAAGGAALIAAMVLFYVLLYKAWNQIQDGHARTNAGQAVGFLFIPFFNFYWLFVAIYGLALDLHNYVVRRGLLRRVGPYPVSPGLALACCIVMLCNVVPVLGFFSILPCLVMLAVLLGQIRSVSAEIASSRLEHPWTPESELEPPPPPPVPVLPPDFHSEQVMRRDEPPA